MALYQQKYRIEPARLKAWDYSSRGWYFVTICCHQRAHIFGSIVDGTIHLSQPGRIADYDLRTLPSHYSNVDVIEHVVMPNHVHAIIFIDGEHRFSPIPQIGSKINHSRPLTPPGAGSLAAIIRSYKSGVTQKCHLLGLNLPVWQSRFHDHLLRGDKVISAVREYIRNNPTNWRMNNENRPW